MWKLKPQIQDLDKETETKKPLGRCKPSEIILKQIFKKIGACTSNEFVSDYELVARFCEHGNELPLCIKYREFLDQPRVYYLLKRECVTVECYKQNYLLTYLLTYLFNLTTE
jgi:hypothetical protein